jgi:stage V sporulation protein K
MFGSLNHPFGGQKMDPNDNKDNRPFNPWTSYVPFGNLSYTTPFSPLNFMNSSNKPSEPNFDNYTEAKTNGIYGNNYRSMEDYNNGYKTGFNNGFSSGHSSGYENGFNAGYLKGYNEFCKLQNSGSPFINNPNYMSPFNHQDYTSVYTSGYDCGIKNYINAINLVNSYNSKTNSPAKNNSSPNSKMSTPQYKKTFNDKSKKSKKNNWNDKAEKNTEQDTNLDISPKSGETKPLLIIRKITKDNSTDTNNLSSMLNNLFGGEEETKKESVNYLEDSDDENDNLVTVDDIKCKEEFIETQKEKFNKVKVVLLKEIINKDNITCIDDLINIGIYYEKNFLTDNTKKNTVKNDDSDTDDENSENSIMNSIIKSLGIPLTPTTNIIINNKTKKTILKSPKKAVKENEGYESENKKDENTFELYKINDCYFTINLEKVYNMKGHLIKLKKMIGLENIKNEIIDMILYYLMDFEKKNNNMLHMTLEGSPGCGKTKLAKIISKLLGALGILDNDKVVYARRTDMIGQYLGQTGQKTQQIINSALGGVLFIDEAYSLGNSKKDIYSKECLDILNQNLSDNKKKLVCIIAGYPEELENYFFSSNPGLTRRFPFRFKINNYTHEQLLDIFVNKINKLNWKIKKNVNLNEFFQKNISHFKFFGGDIDTFIQDIKYSHSRRIVCSHPSEFKIINKDDVNNAFEKFKNRRKDKDNELWKGMFV